MTKISQSFITKAITILSKFKNAIANLTPFIKKEKNEYGNNQGSIQLTVTQGERILFLKGRLDKGFRDHD
jgi:hypothetical protein